MSYGSFLTEWLYIERAWRDAEVSPTDPKITFRGSSLGQRFTGQPVTYQAAYNHFVVSPFDLSSATFERLLRELGSFRPVALWGYPSAIAPFASWVERTGPHPELGQLRGVLLASEGAFDWQLALFDKVFPQARTVQWYGQSEKVGFGYWCPDAAGYHLHPSYGLLENVEGRLVGTSFTNAAMPLVRYDTEDAGTVKVMACGCGSPFRTLVGLEGRWDQAMVFGLNGVPISTTALNFHDTVFEQFGVFQFFQDTPGHLEFRVPREDADNAESASTLSAAVDALQARVGQVLSISGRYVERRSLLTQRGKTAILDQRCNPESNNPWAG